MASGIISQPTPFQLGTGATGMLVAASDAGPVLRVYSNDEKTSYAQIVGGEVGNDKVLLLRVVNNGVTVFTARFNADAVT